MENKTKEYMKLIVFTLMLFAIILYFKDITGALHSLLGIMSCVLWGILIAFVLNVPVSGIENLITKIDKKKKCSGGLKRSLSIFLTFLIIIAVLFLVSVLLIPNIMSTTSSLIYVIKEQLPVFLIHIQKKYNLDLSITQQFLDSLKLDNIMVKVSSMLGGMTVMVGSTISRAFDIMMALIIACYILAGKETLLKQIDRVSKAFMKEKYYTHLKYLSKLISETYSSFLGGQCVEAVILSVFMTIVLAICQIPYATMIGILAGILSFIPYIGSFVACFAGAFFILLINPMQAVVEIIVYQIVQFIEGQFIYPRVVGKSVGLPPLYTLVAALLGGKLFGIIGMIFFIPVFSVLYTLIREITNKRI